MRVLIVDEMHSCILDILSEKGIEVIYLPEINREEFIEKSRNIDGLVVRSKFFVDKNLLKNAEKLKFVARAGAGIDNLDVQYLEERNIEILNAPEGNRDAVGDHTLGLILNLTNRLLKSHKEISKRIWDREGNRGLELSEMTIGIIGFGNTGQAVAQRLSAFNTSILAYDKYKSGFSSGSVKESTLNHIFEEAKLVTIHVPLTYETNQFINEEFVNSFKHPFYLVNTSRGEIADHSALAKGLSSEKILGLGLDVYENEKFSTLSEDQEARLNFFSGHPNCILTPHVAGWTFASYKKISQVIGEKILCIV